MQNLEFHNFVQFFGEGTYGVTHKHGAEKERVQNLRFSVRGGPMAQALPLPAENVKPPDDMSNVASRVCFEAHISSTCACLRQFSRESYTKKHTSGRCFQSSHFALVVPAFLPTKKLNEIVKFEICILFVFSAKWLKYCPYEYRFLK